MFLNLIHVVKKNIVLVGGLEYPRSSVEWLLLGLST